MRRRGCFVGFLVQSVVVPAVTERGTVLHTGVPKGTHMLQTESTQFTSRTLFRSVQSFFHSAGLRKDFPANVLLTASVADHLESCNAQIAVLHFAGCFLNLPLFFFLILFTFCFVGSGAADCHLVANVLVKLNASAS